MEKEEIVKFWLDKFNKSESTSIDECDKQAFENYIYRQLNNISIGSMNNFYLNTNENQNKLVEYTKICKFLDRYVKQYAKKQSIKPSDLHLEFINYGKTELVYVLTNKLNSKRTTLLVKQPALPVGKVKQECNNLIELAKLDNMVVAPIDYYRYDDQELFATPYINQARCVASDQTWGMYVPEPFYRFEPFTAKQEKIVNTCMIAKLISLYNPERKEGVALCRLGGGDFMLPKGWENTQPTIENTINNLYLIAAREKIHCSLSEYEQLFLDEFSRRTINEDNIKINHRGRVAMSFEDIGNGIELGKQLLNKKYTPNQ